jgi:hypothetical protein
VTNLSRRRTVPADARKSQPQGLGEAVIRRTEIGLPDFGTHSSGFRSDRIVSMDSSGVIPRKSGDRVVRGGWGYSIAFAAMTAESWRLVQLDRNMLQSEPNQKHRVDSGDL